VHTKSPQRQLAQKRLPIWHVGFRGKCLIGHPRALSHTSLLHSPSGGTPTTPSCGEAHSLALIRCLSERQSLSSDPPTSFGNLLAFGRRFLYSPSFSNTSSNSHHVLIPSLISLTLYAMMFRGQLAFYRLRYVFAVLVVLFAHVFPTIAQVTGFDVFTAPNTPGSTIAAG
jgi:hypothetical protein